MGVYPFSDTLNSIQSLDDATTVVTVNRRLARSLRDRYDQTQLAQGRGVWSSLDVLPWEQWIQRLWRDLGVAGLLVEPHHLLSLMQERVLWEQVVRGSRVGEGLLQVSTAARQAQEAWRLAHGWHLSMSTRAHPQSQDVEAFHAWAQTFTRRCAQHRWLDQSRLVDVVRSSLTHAEHIVPTRVCLVGFDSLSPQQVDLLNAMELIATVTTLELTPSASTACRVACESVSDEIITAAGWIGALLTEDPGAKIGVVVPALEHYKADIQRSFDHLLCPQLGLGDSSGERPYNLSLGQPLGETSVIAVAMALLEFSCHELPLCKISAALRSAYIGESAVEGVQRSEVDRLLRRAGEALADPIWVLYHIGSDAPAGDVGDREREVCPHLGKRLRQWNSTRLEAARIGKPSHWARHFCALLTDMGWPGERTLDSAEYQAVEAWKEVLAQFSSLDLMLPEVTRATALHHLGRLAHDTLFQPESVAESVQIVGALEAVALDVDHLWVMGMHDQAWPIASTPNPFLSRAEQREAGVPGASPEANLRYSQQLTQQLLRLADEVIISYPTRVDHDEVEVSPLLGSLPEKSPSQISRAPLSDYASVIYAHAGLERVSSDPGPALAGQPVRGGSGVFKAQSACPFRGFAEFRLNAQAPDRLSQGLDPAERGQLLHRVMERVWQNIKSHAALLSLADDSLRQVIDDAVSASVEEAARYKPKTLRGEFQALERSRLSTLVERWMQIERDRAPFTVESTEAKHHLSIAGLEVDCRVDRVDVLDDGQRVLIDYKTGNVAPGDWFGERPFDPQLPLYALLYPERLVALSFARLQPQDIRFQGVSNDALVLPGIKAFASTREGKAVGDWSIQLQAWQASLETLAQEFCAGNAEVVPQHSKSCDHCPLPGLCRIDEMSMLDGESA